LCRATSASVPITPMACPTTDARRTPTSSLTRLESTPAAAPTIPPATTAPTMPTIHAIPTSGSPQRMRGRAGTAGGKAAGSPATRGRPRQRAAGAGTTGAAAARRSISCQPWGTRSRSAWPPQRSWCEGAGARPSSSQTMRVR
jgi:hypothetical protein